MPRSRSGPREPPALAQANSPASLSQRSRAHILTPSVSPPSLSLLIIHSPCRLYQCSTSILSHPSTPPTYRITTLYFVSRQCSRQITSHTLHPPSHMENSLTIRLARHPPLLSLQVLARSPSLSIRLRTRTRPRALPQVSASASSSSSVSVGSSSFAGASGCVAS
jgi:hypothetical protein